MSELTRLLLNRLLAVSSMHTFLLRSLTLFELIIWKSNCTLIVRTVGSWFLVMKVIFQNDPPFVSISPPSLYFSFLALKAEIFKRIIEIQVIIAETRCIYCSVRCKNWVG
jgi:hypothetical protein